MLDKVDVVGNVYGDLIYKDQSRVALNGTELHDWIQFGKIVLN